MILACILAARRGHKGLPENFIRLLTKGEVFVKRQERVRECSQRSVQRSTQQKVYTMRMRSACPTKASIGSTLQLHLRGSRNRPLLRLSREDAASLCRGHNSESAPTLPQWATAELDCKTVILPKVTNRTSDT